jgi:hypothetical protein
MKKSISWFSAILIITIAIYLIDLNVSWYLHPNNAIPVLKYSMVALAIILFIIASNAVIQKRK